MGDEGRREIKAEVDFRWCGECEAVTGVRYPGGDWVPPGDGHWEWHKKLEARFAAIEQAGRWASLGFPVL